MMTVLMVGNPSIERWVEEGRSIMKRIGIPSPPAEMFLKTFLHQTKLSHQDAKAEALAGLLKRFDAYAFMKMDEAWVVERPGGESEEEGARVAKAVMEAGGARAAPDRKEVIIVTMESGQFDRMVSVPILRESGFDSPVVGTGEPKVMENAGRGGRYQGLLRRTLDS